MSSMENIIICSLFLSAFFVILKNTALLIFIISEKRFQQNSKTLQKQGFVYSLNPHTGADFLYAKKEERKKK